MLVYNAQGMSRREQKSMAQIATVPANAHLENMLSRFFFAPNTAMPCVLHGNAVCSTHLQPTAGVY